MSQTLADAMQWRTLSVGAGVMGSVPVPVGEWGQKGPRVSLVAGVHGDEGPWARWAIQKFLASTEAADFQARLKVVAVANPTALANNSRCSPLDSLDLNRSFPGNAAGSHTSMLACALRRFAVEDADLVIDLHGGGSWCVNGFAFYFSESRDLSEAVGAPFLVDASTRNLDTVSVTTCARSHGAQVVAVEMGGSWSGESDWADRIGEGLQRLMVQFGALPDSYWKADFNPSRQVGPAHVIRPSRGGIFEPVASSALVGTVIDRGTILGYVRDPGPWAITEVFEAPFKRTALLLARPGMSILNAGDMTFVVADEP